ncbi:hypothetical protein C0J52_23380 [Blattella germanica]|nr:hypothetical protein C0J52_23380 [Blattella germanica]
MNHWEGGIGRLKHWTGTDEEHFLRRPRLVNALLHHKCFFSPGFKINPKKSKFMSITKKQNDQIKELKMGTYKFEKVKEFTYLGSILTANNDISNETADGWRARYNSEVYTLYKEPDLETHIRFQRLRWLGHKNGSLKESEDDVDRFKITNWSELAMGREGWKRAMEEAKAHLGCNDNKEEEEEEEEVFFTYNQVLYI